MESKIQIDIDVHRQEHISLRCVSSPDVRDKLLAMFVQTSAPDGGLENRILDGYCRLSILGKNNIGDLTVEIVPIHPIDMPKHIKLIRENAEKFTTRLPNEQLPVYFANQEDRV